MEKIARFLQRECADSQASSLPVEKATCVNLKMNNQRSHGAPCIEYLVSKISDKIQNTPVSFIPFEQMKNLDRYVPERIGNNFFYYRAEINNKSVFIKSPLPAIISDILEEGPDTQWSPSFNFFKEVFWTQNLSREHLGPHFLGVTVVERKGIGLALALVTEFLDGEMYKPEIDSGRIPPKYQNAFDTALKRLKLFSEKYGAKPRDLQIMVTANNQALFIDPEAWIFEGDKEE